MFIVATWAQSDQSNSIKTSVTIILVPIQRFSLKQWQGAVRREQNASKIALKANLSNYLQQACHRQSIISSFKIASEKLNHLSLSWCTFLITLPRLRSAFYIKKSFSKMWDWQATFAIYLNSNVSTFLITLQRLRSVFYINKQCSKMWYFKAFQCPSPTYLNSNVSYFLLPSKG